MSAEAGLSEGVFVYFVVAFLLSVIARSLPVGRGPHLSLPRIGDEIVRSWYIDMK